VLATVLGFLASDYFFIEPRRAFGVTTPQQLVSVATYLISCAVVIGFGEGMRRARERAHSHVAMLQENQRQLERAERHKDQFLAMLAHELRNPLAAIRNAFYVMQARPGVDPDRRELAAIIGRQSQLMMRLIDDLLDISRIAAGRLHLEKACISLQKVLAAALEGARPQIASARHSLEYVGPTQALAIHGDYLRLVQVFMNLLGNAVRYTPPGGRIAISVQHVPTHVVVRVRDNGIGIPPQMLTRIFDMFTQVDRHAERTQGGLGIGLTLARRLLELHDGTIEAHSEGPDRGSEFIVRLPLLEHAQAQLPSTADLQLDEQLRGVVAHCLRDSLQPLDGCAAPPENEVRELQRDDSIL
jgi:signal transduction histidine kinase